jgi:predicted MFS family arabinose efflux permease
MRPRHDAKLIGQRRDGYPLQSGETTRPIPGRGVTLTLLAAVFAVHFMDRQILAILIPPIKSEFGLSDTALGLLSGFAFTLLFSTVGLLIARLADVVNRAHVIVASLIAFSAMTVACGFASNYWQLFVARVGVGIGEGGSNPASHALIADLFPMQRRATAMATYSLGPHAGIVLAFALGGWIGQGWGWRAAFLVAGVAGLVLALIALIALRDPLRAGDAPIRVHGAPPTVALRAILGSATLRHLFAGAILATAATLGLVTWLPAMLARSHAMGLAQAGVFLALAFGVAGAIGTYTVGRIADAASTTDGRRKSQVVMITQLLLAISLPLGLLAGERTLALAALIVPCALVGAYIGPTLALVQGLVDPNARAFSAAMLLFAVNLIGAGLGPLAVGVLSDTLAMSAGPQSLRYALLATPVLALWSAYHFARAMPALASELRE